MKPKSIMLFVVAAGCGLVAMIGAQQMLARGPKSETVKVLVAREEIDPGVRLTPDSVVFKEFPKDNVPEGAVTKEEEFAERALKSRGYPGQIILVAQLGEKGQYGTSLQIPEGKRLATLKVDAVGIHSGIMKPGDRVDVVLTYQIGRRGNMPDIKTRTILQYVQVFALGNHTIASENPGEESSSAKDAKSVSLLVSPVQAELLKYAERKGTLHLTLRSTLDKAPVETEGADEEQFERLQYELARDMSPEQVEETPEDTPKKASFAEFVKGPPASAAPAAVKATWKVEVFQGEDKKTYEFDVEEPNNTTSDPASATAVPAASAWTPLKQWFFGTGRTSNTALVSP